MYISAFQNIQDLVPGDHLCCIYSSEEEQRQVVTHYVRLGLEREHKVIYIVDTHTAEAVNGYLEEDGIETKDYIERGQLVFLTGQDTYTSGGRFDPDAMIALLEQETRKAADEGYAALRVTGEMTWALRGLPGSDRLIEYENKLNRFMPKHSCMAICQYDKRRFDAHVLLDVLRTHPLAIIGTRVYDNFYYLPPEKLLGNRPAEEELEHWIEKLHTYAEANETMRQNERRYRNLYNSIRDAILVAGTDRRIIHCNQAFTDLFGYRLEEVEGRETSYVYAEKEEFENLGRRLDKINRSELIFTVHYKKKSGEVFPGETKVFTLDDGEGNVSGYIGLIRDISDKIEAEQQLRRERSFVDAILETSGAIIVILDGNGYIVRVNEACKEITGYTKAEFDRISLWDLIPEDERKEVRQVFDALLGGNYPSTHENHWITKNGKRRFIAWTSTIVRDNGGNVERIIATGIDITEQQKEQEEKIRRLEAEIEELESFSSQGVTPITGRMYAQRSLRETETEAFHGFREEYEHILEGRLEEQMYKTDNNISRRLNDLAQKLGKYDAGPRDVTELHTRALRKKSKGVPYQRAKALSDEGRLIALELMGYLVSFYRSQTYGKTGYGYE